MKIVDERLQLAENNELGPCSQGDFEKRGSFKVDIEQIRQIIGRRDGVHRHVRMFLRQSFLQHDRTGRCQRRLRGIAQG